MKRELLDRAYRHVIKPSLFHLDPEKAHEATVSLVAAIGSNRLSRAAVSGLYSQPHRPVTIAGISFPGVVGLAAGADKDGRAAHGWASLGFSFAELGTVTAKPQPGNPKPRSFRLVESHAILNRMGFNNAGAVALADRLQGWGVCRGEATLGIPLGISIGKSKVTPLSEAVADYVTSIHAVRPYADYVAINVSSPNTPGLRELQAPSFLRELTTALVAESNGVPIFIKVAPDLTDAELDAILDVAHNHDAAGLILTNTTISRDALRGAELARYGHESGGLSGSPLTLRSRELVARVSAQTDLPIIGAGGIMTAHDAASMLDSGAALIQIYSGLIYAGPTLVSSINEL